MKRLAIVAFGILLGGLGVAVAQRDLCTWEFAAAVGMIAMGAAFAIGGFIIPRSRLESWFDVVLRALP